MVVDTDLSRRIFLKGAGAAALTTVLGTRLVRPVTAHAASDSSKLRFGVQVRPEHTTYADMRRAWKEIEALGFDSVFTFDHFMPIDGRSEGPCFEGWTLLAALAAETERLKIGILVTGNTYRFPAVLAKMAATVDHISNGRLILGMGAGWFEMEHQAYGIPFDTAGGRARRLVEAVMIVKQLFTQTRSTFKGRYYEIKDAPLEPKPVQRPHPPILIGGMGPKVIQPLAAREADIWHFFVRDDAELKALCTNFDALCRKAGRNPAAVEKSTTLRVTDLAGKSAREIRDRVDTLSDAGVRHFIISLAAPYDLALLQSFAKDVMKQVRAG